VIEACLLADPPLPQDKRLRVGAVLVDAEVQAVRVGAYRVSDFHQLQYRRHRFLATLEHRDLVPVDGDDAAHRTLPK
jgi:hypothetical protein